MLTPRNPRRRRDAGAATTELVLAAPLMLLLIMLVVQAGLWAHATHITQAAAQRGVEAARADDSTAADGKAAAEQSLDVLGGELIDDPHVTINRSGDTVTATVSGTVEAVIPGVTWQVHARVTGPVEKFTPHSGEAGESP